MPCMVKGKGKDARVQKVTKSEGEKLAKEGWRYISKTEYRSYLERLGE